MISLQPLHLTHSPSGTWIRLCSTGCLGFLIFLNHAISISSYPSRRGQRPESGEDHIATGRHGQEKPSGTDQRPASRGASDRTDSPNALGNSERPVDTSREGIVLIHIAYGQ